MSDLSSHQNVFRIAKNDSYLNGAASKVVRRKRQIVSCLACRQRKIKCNRQVPCLPCTRRGDANGCDFAANIEDGSSPRDAAQVRLQRLEAMVTSLLENQEFNGDASIKDRPVQYTSVTDDINNLSLQVNKAPQESLSKGYFDVKGFETNYYGATHWATILEDIREIQDVLDDSPEEMGEVRLGAGTGLTTDIIVDTKALLTWEEAIAALPPRTELNSLLSLYFNVGLGAIPILHKDKFFREYEGFLAHSDSVTFLWLSMLFSAMHTGRLKGGILSRGPSPSYLDRAGQCLVAGEYHRCKQYSVEAMLLYSTGRFIETRDATTNTWMLMGSTARLAMRMGYHRDPKHLNNVTPFEGEMRRRVFYVVSTFDLLLSFQAGLPAIIDEEFCDTETPRNLFDSDFGEDSIALPPSRPETDPTPMLYTCTKNRLAVVFRQVNRHVLSLKERSYDEVLVLDRRLREVRKTIPASLKMKRIRDSVLDDAVTILCRATIELLYLKSICVLHRKYLSLERNTPSYKYSREISVKAALDILEQQADMNMLCGPSGQFENNRRFLSSIISDDYILAGMIICVDLYKSQNDPIESPETAQYAMQKYKALQQSKEIWSIRGFGSRDAQRAIKVFNTVLTSCIPTNTTVTKPTTPRGASFACEEESTSEEISPPDLSGSTTISNDNDAHLDQGDLCSTEQERSWNSLDSNPLDPFFGCIDTVDWNLVDQCLEGGQIFPLDWKLFHDLGETVN